jgi:general stress protein YciG
MRRGDERLVPGKESVMAKEDRGFASMDQHKRREIASKGGRAAHLKGRAHEWTCEEAREAGRKGAMAGHRKRQERLVVESAPERRAASGFVIF